MKSDRPKILVVDANHQCHSARYSTGSLGFKNIRTGIVFGFLSSILQLGHQFRTNRFVFCWDDKKSSVRKTLSEDYKANRTKEKTDDEKKEDRQCYKQFDAIREDILPEMGFRNSFMQSSLEGDDLMARVVRDYPFERLVVVTEDQDLYQVLKYSHASIYHPRKKVFMNEARFTRKYGIAPVQWVQVKMLAGCTTDNVAGVEGVGEKTAIKFLRKELKETSVVYQRIMSMGGQLTIGFNKALVKLPHIATEKMRIVPDKFSKQGFLRTCEEYGLKSFMGPRMAEWKQLFQGNFDEESR